MRRRTIRRRTKMVTEMRRWMARSSFNSELERNEKGVLWPAIL
jgi:hypothetical protein